MARQRIEKQFNLESLAGRRLKSIATGPPVDLELICRSLNGKESEELRSGLRKLVEAWQKSGPNLAKMLSEDKVLAARTRHGQTHLVPTQNGHGWLIWMPTPEPCEIASWQDEALAQFMALIVNPQWFKLGGPCLRCDKYYVKKTSRQKTYCSRRCGLIETATAATRKRRERERVRKLGQAQAVADHWVTIRTRVHWKDWVSARTKLTTKWLTRAVNKGDLKPPVKNGNG